MTVAELLERIMAVYAGATSEAMKAVSSVYYKRLRKHEGEPLEAAADEVFATFKATTRQPFPISGNFEDHLPSGKIKLPDEVALDWDAHKRRKRDVIADWERGQGSMILQHRGPYVWVHCWLHAKQLAHDRAWSEDPKPIVLSAEEIERCENQVTSTARMATYGARVLRRGDAAEWGRQMAECRSLVRTGNWPKDMTGPGEISSSVRPSARMQNRLAQLATAWRRGEPPPPMEAP